MSNNCYFLASNSPGLIEPVAGNILLEAPYHLPLVWMLGLASDDIMTMNRLDNEGRDYLVCGAWVARQTFIDRLASRIELARLAFAARGDVGYHMALFADWLATQNCAYLCINWTEYNFLNGDDHEWVVAAVGEAAQLPHVGISKLLETSTVIDGARFITLDQARAGDFSQDEQFTFFRLLGNSYSTPVPWL